jgi:hypothetical protein
MRGDRRTHRRGFSGTSHNYCAHMESTEKHGFMCPAAGLPDELPYLEGAFCGSLFSTSSSGGSSIMASSISTSCSLGLRFWGSVTGGPSLGGGSFSLGAGMAVR